MSKHIETHTQTGGVLHTWHSAQVRDKETGNWGSSGHCETESEAVREAIRDLAHENLKKG
jgi:hypothetical protein